MHTHIHTGARARCLSRLGPRGWTALPAPSPAGQFSPAPARPAGIEPSRGELRWVWLPRTGSLALSAVTSSPAPFPTHSPSSPDPTPLPLHTHSFKASSETASPRTPASCQNPFLSPHPPPRGFPSQFPFQDPRVAPTFLPPEPRETGQAQPDCPWQLSVGRSPAPAPLPARASSVSARAGGRVPLRAGEGGRG